MLSPAYYAARKEAEVVARRRVELFTEASNAYREGRGEEARRFSEEGRRLGAAMRAANEVAVGEVLGPQNLAAADSIDLYGLLVDEAVNATKSFVESCRGRFESVEVFTGPVQQSNRNSTIGLMIQPAIIELCGKEGWRVDCHESKAGCLTVFVPKPEI